MEPPEWQSDILELKDSPVQILQDQKAQAQSVMQVFPASPTIYSPTSYSRLISSEKSIPPQTLSEFLLKAKDNKQDSPDASLKAYKLDSPVTDTAISWHRIIHVDNVDGLESANTLETTNEAPLLPSGLQCNDELEQLLDNISSAGQRLQKELDKSQNQKTVLAAELRAFKNANKCCKAGINGGVITIAPACLPQKLFTDECPEKENGIHINNTADHEPQSEKVQKGVLPLGEEHLSLRGNPVLDGLSTKTNTIKPAFITPLQQENESLLKVVAKIEKEKLDHIVSFKNLKEMEEKASVHPVAFMINVVTENNMLQEEIKDREKHIRELENILLIKIEDIKMKQKCKISLLEEKLQSKMNEVFTAQHSLNCLKEAHQQRIEEEQNKFKELEAASKACADNLKKEISMNEEKNHEKAKEYNELRERFLDAEKNNKTFLKELKFIIEKYRNLKKHVKTLEVERHQNFNHLKSITETLEKANKENQKYYNECILLREEKGESLKFLEEAKDKINSLQQERYRIDEEKQILERDMTLLKEINTGQEEKMKLINAEYETAKKILSAHDSEKETLLESIKTGKDEIEKLRLQNDRYLADAEYFKLQIEQIELENKKMEKKFHDQLHQFQTEHRATKKTLKELLKEREALAKMVNNLKEDKNLLKNELKEYAEHKNLYEEESKKLFAEIDKLKENVAVMEKENFILKLELSEMQNNYLSMSDRITARLNGFYTDEFQKDDQEAEEKLKKSSGSAKLLIQDHSNLQNIPVMEENRKLFRSSASNLSEL
ncbi:uncharacterized protein PFB0765w-like isoform X2 [Protopterus annectens]|uniref:uncharacterized protein PFB0765w-like isoform X2 n=1 Tax=Protopterus annectens TaxID=7888 RepID=UPI001CF978C8|nr:uncharacterized protein PFB0765w-like isoform X2 [Protopterus annectens]